VKLILIPPSEGKNLGGENPPITYSKTTKQIIQDFNLKLDMNALPAIQRYKGVVYKGIDYPTLKNKELFNKHVRIISGLFGMIEPEQNIPNYKLQMDKTHKYWDIDLSEYEVIDCLPKVHRKAVKHNGIEINFFQIKNGKRVNAGHNGKLIKGRFVRWLIENNFPDFKEFPDAKWNGEEFEM
jgi:cytoplasmic iron level regulating protein YaaA (DUF328/UPF0246 family)